MMRYLFTRLSPVLVALFTVVGCSAPVSTDLQTFFRFDDQLETSSQNVSVTTIEKEGPRVVFDGASSAPWTVGKPSSSCSIENGTMVFTAQETDTLASAASLGIDGTAVDSLVIELAVTNADCVSLEWRIKDSAEFEPHRLVNIHISKPDEMVTYTIQVAGVRSFRHREIDQFRLSTPKESRILMKRLQVVSRRETFSGSQTGVREFSINNRVRPCLFMHCPARATYIVNIPERARFSAGLGVFESSAPVIFRLTAKQGESEKTIWEKSVTSLHDWEDVSVDLGAYAGQDLALTLQAESEDPRQIAFWSNPVLYQARADRAWYERGSRAPYNVIVYVVDCLRADHLDAYGYPRKTGPNMVGFGLTGTRFLRHYSQETWTKPSMSTLATGVPSLVHGVNLYGDVIPDSLLMLPGVLRRAGYATCAISENPHTPPDASQRRAYCYMEAAHLGVELNDPPLKWNQLPDITFERASAFMESHVDAPFFLYVHTMEPHDVVENRVSEQLVYDPPEPFRYRWASRDNPAPMDFYDECIAYADSNFRRFLDRVEDLGLRKNTLIILTADHGEAFGEHEGKMGHAGKPYNELIRVPMIMSLPGVIPGRNEIDVPTQMLDTPPTILDMLGLPPQQQFQGLSLRPLLESRSPESYQNRMIVSTWAGNSSAILGRWKLLDDVHLGKKMLFGLVDDPTETRDISAERSDLFGFMSVELSANVAGAAKQGKLLQRTPETSPGQTIDALTQEQLEDLGYLGAGRRQADKKEGPKKKEESLTAGDRDGKGEGGS